MTGARKPFPPRGEFRYSSPRFPRETVVRLLNRRSPMPLPRPLRASVLAILALAGIAGCRGPGGAPPPPGRPNLVLVTLDTVRADHLGCYGDAQAITPWLDRLAGEGTR